MNIISLSVDNIKRISAVKITPSGHVVTIGGKNGAGKSSVIDSIAMALEGAAAIPGVPLHRGAIKGEVVVDLGEIVVTRTFTEKGGTSLVVKNAAGGKLSSPQSILDAMVGKLSFDPLEFTNQDRKKQLETLKTLVGLDFTDLDAKRAALFDKRTVVGKDGQAWKERREIMPFHPGVPDIEQTALDVLAQIEAARKHNAKRGEIQAQIERHALAESDAENRAHQFNGGNLVNKAIADAKYELQRRLSAVTSGENVIAALEAEIETLGAKLAQARLSQQGLVDAAASGQAVIGAATAAAANAALAECVASREFKDQLTTTLAAIEESEVEPLLAQVRDIEGLNKKVRDNLAQRNAVREVEAARAQWDELTGYINAIDEYKRGQMSAAKFPVPGLSFDTTQVLLNGLPFDQASKAEQVRVSVAMALAMNPKLKVILIRDGSLLDEDSLATVAKMAHDNGAQIWLEKVTGNASECSVLIEDGTMAMEGLTNG